MLLKQEHTRIPEPTYAGTVTQLLIYSQQSKLNPTTLQAVEVIANRAKHAQPVVLAVSQPVILAKEVQDRRFLHILGKPPGRSEIERFITGFSTQHWSKLKEIMESCPCSVELKFMVDDLSVKELHLCEYWCNENEKERLNTEIDAYTSEIAKQAQSFFANSNVQVQRWSKFCSNVHFSQAHNIACDWSRWGGGQATGLMESGFEAHYDILGIARAWQDLSISREDIIRLVLAALPRMAALFRIKADVIKEEGWIQLITGDDTPNPLWTLAMENYAGAGCAPSFILKT